MRIALLIECLDQIKNILLRSAGVISYFIIISQTKDHAAEVVLLCLRKKQPITYLTTNISLASQEVEHQKG